MSMPSLDQVIKQATREWLEALGDEAVEAIAKHMSDLTDCQWVGRRVHNIEGDVKIGAYNKTHGGPRYSEDVDLRIRVDSEKIFWFGQAVMDDYHGEGNGYFFEIHGKAKSSLGVDQIIKAIVDSVDDEYQSSWDHYHQEKRG